MPNASAIAIATKTIVETLSCNCCNSEVAANKMSVFSDLCLACFDEKFTLCTFCGCRLERPATPNTQRFGTVLTNRTYVHEYDLCCYSCYNERRYSDCDYWKPTPSPVSCATYTGIGSKRKFGVEVETSYCSGFSDLKGNTLFGCKDDPSVGGMEFDSPILYGDEGLDTIREFLAHAYDEGWSVDNSCGCHTHYDMRDESDEQLYRTHYAYALTYVMWKQTVSRSRAADSYCHSPSSSATDIRNAFDRGRSFQDWASRQQRYDFLNAYAYGHHGTFEVRLLEGSLDPVDICNWITLHARFIDKVRNLDFATLDRMFRFRGDLANKKYSSLVELIDDKPLTDWLEDKANDSTGSDGLSIVTLPTQSA